MLYQLLLTIFVYKNGVHYIDSLQDAVESQGDEKGNKSDEIYISIPDDKWDEFADEFSVQVYNNKADYKRNSLIITVLLALLGGAVTYFISGHALRPIREFSDKIEEVQAQNLSDSRIEENNVKELNQLGISYNKMLERLSEAFEIQRQFTANAAHELRTPLALMQVQLDLYNSASHPGNDADTLQTIKMVTEQNDKLNRMVKTLLDMSELQTVGRDDKIILDAIVEEVLADLGFSLSMVLFGPLYLILVIACATTILEEVMSRFLNLYLLIGTAPVALCTIAGGRGLDNTAVAWFKSFLTSVLQIAAIAFILQICSHIINSSTFGEAATWDVFGWFNGAGNVLMSIVTVVFLTAAVKGSDAFLKRAFDLR